MTERIFPHNPDVERAIIAAMVMDAEALQVGLHRLSAMDFYSPSHQKIFEAIQLLETEGSVVDLTLLSERLRMNGVLEQVGGVPSLAGILQSAATSANIEYHIGILKEKSGYQEIIRQGTRAVDRAFAEEDKPSEIFLALSDSLINVSLNGQAEQMKPIGDYLGAVLEEIELGRKSKTFLYGVESGIVPLDYYIGGFPAGDLSIIAARTGIGKTVLANQIAENMTRVGKRVCFFPLEMNRKRMMMRLLTQASGISTSHRGLKYMTDEDYQRIVAAANNISDFPLFYYDGTITLSGLLSYVKLMHKRFPIDAVIVDYLQLVGVPVSQRTRENDVSNISRGLKNLSREMDIPVIALSQFSRRADDDREPRMSDLRESGAIEQDAGLIVFIHRKAQKKNEEGDSVLEDETKISVVKYRHGSTGSFRAKFNKTYLRFDPVDDWHKEAPPDYQDKVGVQDDLPF